MAEAKWRQLLGKPSGALPPNVVQKVVLPLVAVLLVVVFLTSRGGPEEEGIVDPESEAVDQGIFEGFLSSMQRNREQAALEQRIAADRQAAEETAAAAMARLGARAGTLPGVLEGRAPSGAAEGAAELALTEGEAELREMLRLEALERRTRSLRASSLVQTFRDPDRTTGGGAAAPPPPAAQGATGAVAAVAPETPPPALAEQAALAAQLQQAAAAGLDPALAGSPAGAPGGGTQARTVPGVTGPEARETPEPATVTTPLDPPGTERVYEGAMLSAVLVNQLDGDFTGPVLAQVAIPFYTRDRQR
ncbi:MAG: hypothetical protein OXH69_23280, partial [Acidobacteria bacterium]|nr:hypothetical protein [Acidobacteriota bacterium]